MTIRIDLHSHTTHSDGILKPAELVQRALRAGVTHLAVTDHDTISGIGEAMQAAGTDLRIIHGLEVSAMLHERECHVLGLLVRSDEEALVSWCRTRLDDRRSRIEHMLRALERLGVSVTLDEVIAESGGHTLARPHLARALLKRGLVRTQQEAFDRYLSRREVAAASWTRPSAKEAIALIHSAGGIASIAHPGANQISAAELKGLAEDGLDAVEAIHPDHPPSQTGAYIRWARDLGLQWTGGSDFHGTHPIMAELGTMLTPVDQWEALEERAHTRYVTGGALVASKATEIN